MSLIEDDIDAMLAAMPDSKTFVLGAASGPCVLDSADSALGLTSGTKSLRGKVVVATVRTTAFPGLKNGDLPTVDGVSHRVRDHQTEDDGLTMRVDLEIL